MSDPDVDVTETPVVLFDGVCNFCSWSVRFIHRHDDGTLRFAPLQSDVAGDLLAAHGLEPDYFDSLVYIGPEGVHTKSDGAVHIARHMDLPYSLGWHLRYVPRVLRDVGYDLVARIRYRVWGKKDECMVPDAELRDRFLATSDGVAADAAAGSPAAD
jgi:predicted DCC family thiol-disulfide oxidoreductase YuxK